MKLESIHRGIVYLSRGRDLYTKKIGGQCRHRGTVPNPHTGLLKAKYEFASGQLGRYLCEPFTGRIHSATFWPISSECIFANVTKWLFRSDDGGRSWQIVRELCNTSGIRGIMPRGFCYYKGTVYIGEYVFGEETTPRVLASDNLGENWYTVTTCSDVRHIHSVQIDPYTNDLWITTGDSDQESMVCRIDNGEVEIIGSGSQLWRAVQLLFLPESIMWGTDVSYQDNHIIRLDRDNITLSNPKFDILHTTNNPFFYAASAGNWVVFSTSASASRDSTAPNAVTTNTDMYTSVWMASKESSYQNWILLCTHNHKENIFKKFGLSRLTASSYVFLEVNKKQHIYMNPYNTEKENGHVLKILRKKIGAEYSFEFERIA